MSNSSNQQYFSSSKQKQNQGSRRSTTTSSALALLAFLFFLNVLQRSLDDNKQGPIVMTRTTIKHAIPRNDLTKNKQIKTTTRNNIYVTKYENIFNK
ncbi:uncharacterized protein LOC112688835 [Sipha flava]|uniref:Uncharacterized protein LOC112688835 n=1 Tax=Sipha flava TaxID=143950 RepID=A0A8B8G5Z4_9HEMI|nr:uncharacterized protein LOC112688835 [Sipha flava]